MIPFETDPASYRHWHLRFDGDLAFLDMDVCEDAPLRPEYRLKLNSYDLGVDIELADAVQRLRFEHPEVRAVILRSAKDGVFCAGANIFMLGTSSHPFKVNFCKFTNETRLAIEDAGQFSRQYYIAACNGTTAGGGYELALACEEILLVDDGNSAVSLPETALLGVLPGTGGLTRVVDKRKVRRDRADVFCTLAEGIKGQRALDWGLVDVLIPRSRFEAAVLERARTLAGKEAPFHGRGIRLDRLNPAISGSRVQYRHCRLDLDNAGRIATLTVNGPETDPPCGIDDIHAAGADFWPLRCFREIDHALLHLRFHAPEIGVLIIRTEGALERVVAMDAVLARFADDWLVRETVLHIKRTLKRLELSARTIFALIERNSCFAGTLLELALGADRSYMLDEAGVAIALTGMNGGALPMSNGLSRLQTRFLALPGRVHELLRNGGVLAARAAEESGLVTFAVDGIDYEDDVRIAVEERASLSPDALTGMEANLRFAGPETLETKIFGRLSAWQNWIFMRPNAVGKHGALALYGQPERARFDWERT